MVDLTNVPDEELRMELRRRMPFPNHRATVEVNGEIVPDFNQYDGLPTLDLVRAMHELNGRVDRLDDEQKLAQKHLDHLRFTRVPTAFETDGIDKIKVVGVGLCYLSDDVMASIKANAKGAAFTWLQDTGRGDLIQPTVNSSSLKASVKEALKKGEAFPEELFNVTPVTRAAIRKG